MRRTGSHTQRSCLAILLCALFASACATGPDLGARSNYSGQTLEQITVAPLYARSTFGANPRHMETILELGAVSAVRALETYGYRVSGPNRLRERLQQHGLTQSYRDGVVLRNDLENHFERERDSGEARLESHTLVELQRALPSRYVLFGQIIYHTSTTCRVEPHEHQPLAHVEPDGIDLPTPCVVSHVAFKLVDARSGETMWFNKVYVETRDQRGEQVAGQSLSRAIARALVGERGIPTYFRPSSTESAP